MKQFLSLLITGSKLGALLCLSAMGAFVSPVVAESIPPCHQAQQINNSSQDKSLLKSSNCLACKISQDVWENPLVRLTSDFYGKLFETVKSYECPFWNKEPKCKLNRNHVSAKDPPNKTNCPCQQLKMKNSVQLRL